MTSGLTVPHSTEVKSLEVAFMYSNHTNLTNSTEVKSLEVAFTCNHAFLTS